MKFAIVVVMLVCAFAAVQSSVIAQYSPGVSYVSSVAHPGVGVWGSPWGAPWGAGHAAVAVHAAPYVSHGYGIPGISLAQGPGHAAVYAAPVAHGHEGVYVAKTRGAVHTAPLAGHVNSATSLNLAPAPGTL